MIKLYRFLVIFGMILIIGVNCCKKKNPLLWFLIGENQTYENNFSNTTTIPIQNPAQDNDNNSSTTSSQDINNDNSSNNSSTGSSQNENNNSNTQTGTLQITYDNNNFSVQSSPEGAFEGVLLAGPDSDTNAFGSVVPPCADVSCLLDRILSTIANWNEVATNGYSLINRYPLNNSILPSEAAHIQLTTNQNFTANELRNLLVALIGTVDGSGNVSNFPDNPQNANLDNQFRIVIQVTQDNDGNAIILVGVTTSSNYANVEDEISELTDGTNIGPVNATPYDYTDHLFADNPPKADFLFVVDNSPSMSEEQNAVQQNSLVFFDRLSLLNVDFKIGTITTDNSNLRHTGFTNVRSEFEISVQAGINGSGKESCVYYAEKALSNNTTNNMGSILTNGNGSINTVANAGYPRNGSTLSVICITDESDAYTKWDGSGSNSDSPRFNLSNNLFKDRNIPFYGIIPLNDSGQYGSCIGVNGNANVYGNFSESIFSTAALNIQTLAENTNASVSSIGGENYGAFLQQLADQVAAKASSYFLTRIPISSTIKVYVNNVEIERTSNPPSGSTGYKYISSENKIVFTGSIPQAGSPIVISYQSYQQ